jgi:hypothetical protein
VLNVCVHTRIPLIAIAVALAVPATATAAPNSNPKPSANTGGANNLTPTSVTLHGSVNPEGTPTSYYFQYGKTRAYGAQTGPVSAGTGKRSVAASSPITGLAPATTYHYRIVATNIAGATVGKDHDFKTKAQPLALTLTATPNPALFGATTTLTGQLTGTGGPGANVILQQNAFPYTAGFQTVGNPQVTDAAGNFAFAVLSLTSNTQFRVLTADKKAASAVVTVGSAVIVRLTVKHKVKRHHLLRFAGTVSPAEDGALYAVQREKGGTWVTVAGASLHHYKADRSRYSRRVRIAHSGTYRVFVGVNDGSHTSNSSSTRSVKATG